MKMDQTVDNAMDAFNAVDVADWFLRHSSDINTNYIVAKMIMFTSFHQGTTMPNISFEMCMVQVNKMHEISLL